MIRHNKIYLTTDLVSNHPENENKKRAHDWDGRPQNSEDQLPSSPTIISKNP